MPLPNLPPDDLCPLTQDNAYVLFDFIFAPWIKEMGLTDIVVREGFVSMRLPLNDRNFTSTAAARREL